MPTNVIVPRIDSAKSQTAPSAVKTGLPIFLFCMIGLVASLVLLSSFTVVPDLSDVAQLVGP